MSGKVTAGGTEVVALETHGTIAEAHARAIVGPGIALRAQDGRVELDLLVRAVAGMKPLDPPIPGLPDLGLPGVDYREALFRIGVWFERAPAWFLAASLVDGTLVRAAGRFMVRAPMSDADVAIFADPSRASARVASRGEIVEIDAIVRPERVSQSPARRALVRDAGVVYEIPWQEGAAKAVAAARVNVRGALAPFVLGGDVAWSGEAIVVGQRDARIGVAAAVPGASLTGG